jgi:hypothetical protein
VIAIFADVKITARTLRRLGNLDQEELVMIGKRLSAILFMCVALIVASFEGAGFAADAPLPLLEKGKPPVDWWFVFKFNTATFPGCAANAQGVCVFGGEVENYKGFSQQFVFASSDNPSLQPGKDCAGDTTADPIGATFDQVFNGSAFYVIWNDQFYDDPEIQGCSKSCSGPWGHSKGMLGWNEDGEGFVLQVIPLPTDQNRYAQSRKPMEIMRHGWSTSLFQASQQWSTTSS